MCTRFQRRILDPLSQRECLAECDALGTKEQRETLCEPCTLSLAKGDSQCFPNDGFVDFHPFVVAHSGQVIDSQQQNMFGQND